MIDQFFADYYPEFRRVVKRNVREWGELPSGPFNTDPIIEPRLKFLSRNPEYAIVHSETEEDGRLSLCVMFRCKAVIRCKKYLDHGQNEPLSTTPFSGGVTYEIPVSLIVEPGSGEIDDFEISEDLAWEKWDNWPKEQDQ